jgi:hypothetical protein
VKRSKAVDALVHAVGARTAVLTAIESEETDDPLDLLLDSRSATEILNLTAFRVPTGMSEQEARRIVLTTAGPARDWRLTESAAERIAELALENLNAEGFLEPVIRVVVETLGERVDGRAWDSGGPGSNGWVAIYNLGVFWSVSDEGDVLGPFWTIEGASTADWEE